MEKNLLKITGYGHFADNCESDQAGSGYSHWRGTGPKIVTGCGIERLYFGPSLLS